MKNYFVWEANDTALIRDLEEMIEQDEDFLSRVERDDIRKRLQKLKALRARYIHGEDVLDEIHRAIQFL